jgi:hypothetical protein
MARPRNDESPENDRSLPSGDDAEPGFDEPRDDDADESETDASIIPP